MENKNIALFALVAIMLAAPLAFAQPKVVADIPFDFAVGSKPMSAGQYEVVRTAGSPDKMVIQSVKRGTKCVALVYLAETDSEQYGAPPKLVFHRYGDRAFLRQVWTDGNGRELLMSKAERRVEIARGKPVTEKVIAQTR